VTDSLDKGAVQCDEEGAVVVGNWIHEIVGTIIDEITGDGSENWLKKAEKNLQGANRTYLQIWMMESESGHNVRAQNSQP